MPADGCMRGTPPCAPFSGIRDVLRAVASQQKAGGGFEVAGLDLRRARLGRRAAERLRARRRDAALAADQRPGPRRLPGADRARCYALGASRGRRPALVEPVERAQRHVLPQPAARGVRPLVAAAVARGLHQARPRDARRARAAARASSSSCSASSPGCARPRLRGSGVEEFYAALPDDVVCTASVYAQHAYAERGRRRVGTAARRAARGRARQAPVRRRTSRSGSPRPASAARRRRRAHRRPRERSGATAARSTRRCADGTLDPRVEAAFQYTFRDDPAFPVGLADAGLTRTWPAYDEWLAWGGDRPAAGPAPALPAACAGGADAPG